MGKWLYVFTSKGIQEFILAGDKLRLMTGGSEIVESLSNDFLNSVLEKLTLQEGADRDFIFLSRAAGGVRMLFNDKSKAEALAQCFPLLAGEFAPGLSFTQALQEVHDNLGTAMIEAEKKLQACRSIMYAAYPVPGPLVKRVPRSGKAMTEIIKFGVKEEPSDAVMAAKRKYSEINKSKMKELLPEGRNLKFAEDFEDISGGEKGSIAILHADGNGLGKMIIDLVQGMADSKAKEGIYVEFSKIISECTFNALKAAIDKMSGYEELKGNSILPARPLVCAGDDVTIVLKSKYAISFASDFIEGFESETARAIKKFKKIYNEARLGGEKLTMAAGVVYVKRKFPFAQAYEICESLVSYTKKQSERKYSALSFWRLTTSAASDFDSVLTDELTINTNDRNKKDSIVLTCMPYAIGDKNKMKTYKNLENLKKSLNDMPNGSVRELLTETYSGKARADQAFERIKEIAKRKNEKELKAFTDALGSITEKELWDASNHTPLYDAVELIAAEKE